MYLQFREEFHLPVAQVYPYFATPADWAKLYGEVKPTKNLGDGWYAVGLKYFPFPLVAKNVVCVPEKIVRWEFNRFWRGIGEVNFREEEGKTVIEGFEYITPHGFWILSSLFEKFFMEKQFANIWNLGWQRIRSNEF